MKTKRTLSLFLALALLVLAPAPLAAQGQQQPGIPPRPSDLKFQPLSYTPPKREQYRHVLPNGVVVYAVEDHDLPLVNVSAIVRTGSYLEPAEKQKGFQVMKKLVEDRIKQLEGGKQ